ncbi:MAG: hypothetical protein P8046_13410 [Anaerolineales bacterium]
MKAEIRILIRDIQAAARLGHADSLYAALDGLLDLPQFSGNHPIPETTLQQVILPIGQVLARPRINAATLRPLTTHSYAVFRATAAAALTFQYLQGINGTTLKDLTALGQDPRDDVRDAIRLALDHHKEDGSEMLDALYETWLKSGSPRLQALALGILPQLPDTATLEKIRHLKADTLKPNPEFKKTLANTLSQLAGGDYPEEVIALLENWAAQPEPDIWLISRCLAKPWAASYPQQSLALLETLAADTGPNKQVRKALLNLYQYGAQTEVLAAVQAWQHSDNPRLSAAGRDEKLHTKL